MKRKNRILVEVVVLIGVSLFLYLQDTFDQGVLQRPRTVGYLKTVNASIYSDLQAQCLHSNQAVKNVDQRTSLSLSGAVDPHSFATRSKEQPLNGDDHNESPEMDDERSSTLEKAQPTPFAPTTTPSETTTLESTSTSSAESEKPTGKENVMKNLSKYIDAILSPENNDFPRLECPGPKSDRYDYLKVPHNKAKSTKAKYFFALDLYQFADGLPRLLGSVIETVRFLGPHNCYISIVEGRSTDGTWEILASLDPELEKLGTQYRLENSGDINPLGNGMDRIKALAELRNMALTPLFETPSQFDFDTTVIFINDVAPCMEDILELIHQRVYQNADMVCAMDWIYGGSCFYDVWVSRQMNGDLFFEIPQNGGWEYVDNLLWNDPKRRELLDRGQPFQVFSCWNGATAFTARPMLKQGTKFRGNREGECYLGEPVHFAKDLWKEGYGKIATIPSVNIGYNDEESKKIKEWRGSVSKWIEKVEDPAQTLIEWELDPPKRIKCVVDYTHPTWVLWNE